jgi:hypothetical protein
MKDKVRTALSTENPIDFLWSLEGAYHYTGPGDYASLPDGGKMAVALSCFCGCFASGGYRQVIMELHAWLPDIARMLAVIDAEPFAGEVQRLMHIAEERGLDLQEEDDADLLEELDDYHRLTTHRDLPHINRVSEALRQYVKDHEDAF